MTIPMQPWVMRTQDPNLLKLKAYLISTVTTNLSQSPGSPAERLAAIQEGLARVYTQTKITLPDNIQAQLFREIVDDLVGYGPIQFLLDDPEVTEVMVNGSKDVFIERRGKLIKTEVTFESDEHVMRIIESIILPLGRRVDAESPMVDARLPDGSRVNAVIPPVAIDGPSITIRKFGKENLTVDQLIDYKSLTRAMADFLQACVMARLNIVISGGTGSGKTTLLNVLSSFIATSERIVTIEDAAELRIEQDNLVRLESRPPDSEGHGQVVIRDLVRNSLRMRPDRIIVGECRGGEALDMLQAMNTGHDGSMTTIHANKPRDALSRLEMMVLMAGMDIPMKVVRQQIASAVDLIVQQSRLKDGTRKITAIAEVAGMEGDVIVMSDIFKFEQTGVSTDGKVIGEVKPTGIRPLFSPRLEAAGFKLGMDMFNPGMTDILAQNRRK